MSETKEAAPVAGKIASAGAPERGEIKTPQTGTATTTATNTGDNNNQETAEKKEGITVKKRADGETTLAVPDLTDEQFKELFAKKGIEGFDGNFEALKEKLSKADKPADAAPTDEEKKVAEAASEKRMLDFHIANGGTVENFVALKQIAAMDLKELSVAEIRKELTERKFDKDEIDIVLKERYFQLNPDELVQGDEESEEDFKKRQDFAKKKATYGEEKLHSRSAYTKQNAEILLENLRDAIKAEDVKKQKENQWLSKVDDYSKKVSRQLTFDLGEVDSTKIDPVQFDVTDADVAKVVEILKDPAQRKQYSITADETSDLPKLTDLLLRNIVLESLLKAGFIEGGNRQVAFFKKTFPNTPHALGVGGAPQSGQQGRKGVIKTAGQPEVQRRST